MVSILESRKPKVPLKFLEGPPLLWRFIHNELHVAPVVRLEHATVDTAPDVLRRKGPVGLYQLGKIPDFIQIHYY
jgi:hypothetical protein